VGIGVTNRERLLDYLRVVQYASSSQVAAAMGLDRKDARTLLGKACQAGLVTKTSMSGAIRYVTVR
jgi:DNA-binding transcriptional regulator LsrR (DeoR family)